MASEQFEGHEKRRFPTLVAGGVVLAAVVIAVAFAADPDVGWALLVLTVICAAAALTFWMVTGSGRTGGSDSDAGSAVPRQEARAERPLGDTPEAHDEINPHDIPIDSPERQATEEAASGADGTTRGTIP